MTQKTITIFTNTYSGESLADMERDVYEATSEDYSSTIKSMPVDEHGFTLGTFKVTIEWTGDDE